MNALQLKETAHKVATTHMEVTIARAALDIDLHTIIGLAMVSLRRSYMFNYWGMSVG